MLRLAIPTYRRSQTIANKTLRYLNEQGYPPPLIYLFVASEEEKVNYENNVPFYLYGQIVVGVPGIVHQRNFITQYFNDEELLIEMDDDIESIYCMTGGFKELVTYATNLLRIGQGGLFGVMPNDDKRVMCLQTTTHLAFIIGTFSIRRNHHSIILTQPEKEDYERTIKYFLQYRKVYRYKAAGVKTRYLKNEGGLQDGHRLETMEECVQYLCDKYPTIVRRREKNGMPDLMLNWRYK